jgi:hypothetical protein
MRILTKWVLLLSIALLSLWAAAQVTVTNELLPWIADNGTVVWQELLWDQSQPLGPLNPRRTDLFQVPVSFPPLPAPNVGIRALQISPPTNLFVLPNPPAFPQFAGRPQISADGRWLVYYAEDGQVYVKDLSITDPNDPNYPPRLISYKQWVDSDNDNNWNEPLQPSTWPSVLPAISGNGRIIAFLSQDPELYDPDRDGDPTNNPSLSSPTPLWFIYIHDRDADGNGVFDEKKVGGTTTEFLPDPSAPTGNTPLLVRLTEVRLSLDATGATLAFSAFTGTEWQLYMADWQSGTVNLIATSKAPLSIPSVAGSRIAFSAVNPFLLNGAAQPLPPGVWVFDVTLGNPPTINPVVGILTNGVNGAPVLSRDGNLLAFHSTATAYQRFGLDPQLRFFDFNGDNVPDDRNGVDDVFVFDLTTRLPVWSTLLVRGLGTPPITLFEPCVNPALPSSNVPMIAFQQIVNGASRVRVVRSPNIVLR